MIETTTKKWIIVVEAEKPPKLNKYKFHSSSYSSDAKQFKELVEKAGGSIDYMIITYFANTLQRGYLIYYNAPHEIERATLC